MLDALTHGEDVRIGRLHLVVDDDPAIDGEAGFVRELDVRPDTGRHHDEIRLERAVIGQRHPLDVAVAEHGNRRAPEQDTDAELLHLGHQVVPGVRVELPLHQRRHQVHDGDVAALDLQPARRLEAQQATANHDRPGRRPRAANQLARVVERAEREDAVLVEPLDLREPGGAAGGEQQRVVGRDAAVIAGDRLEHGVDVDHADAETKRDAVALVPLERIEDDVVGAALAGEHRRQHDAVVVDVRLVAEDGDLELRRVREDLLHARHPGHSVADHHQAFHRASPGGPMSPGGPKGPPLRTQENATLALSPHGRRGGPSGPPVSARSTRTADCL